MPDIDIDVRCANCYGELDSQTHVKGRAFYVIACERCLQVAEEKAYDKGYTEGYKEGQKKATEEKT